MLKFKKLERKDFNKINEYIKNSEYKVCDLSVGVMLMYNDYFNYEIAYHNDTLIVKLFYDKVKQCFYPPLGKDISGAITEIEKYCTENEKTLSFTCVEESFLEYLKSRYSGDIDYFYNRNWSDYLYDFSEIESFAGGKFSGQRNHINKFKKNYPNYKYSKIEVKDIKRVERFLKKYQTFHTDMKGIEKAEYLNTFTLFRNYKKGYFIGGKIEIDGKIVAVSLGEYTKNSLIIHTEKALTTYQGIYPTAFNEFVRLAKKDGIIYINREDDAGDMGLRTSKTQYKPISLIHKNFVTIKKPFNIQKKPILKGDGICLTPIRKSETQTYYKLCTNKSLNKYWGYDYTKDISDLKVDSFYKMQLKDYKEKNNLCLAIREKQSSKMLGEVILYNFSYDNKVELGIRLFKKEQSKGYGTKAMTLLADYVEEVLNKKATAKCYKNNLSSQKMLLKCGFDLILTKGKFCYFEKTKKY